MKKRPAKPPKPTKAEYRERIPLVIAHLRGTATKAQLRRLAILNKKTDLYWAWKGWPALKRLDDLQKTLECKNSKRYKGILPPRCNDGKPCFSCKNRYARRKLGL